MKFPLISIQCQALLIICLLLVGCGGQELQVNELSGRTMGTSYSVKIVTDTAVPATLQAEIDATLISLNDVFSTYLPDSELSRLNQRSGIIPISAELARVLKLSHEIYELSSGAFDPTIGPLINLWGFGADGPREGVPTAEDIARALKKTGFDGVVLGEGELTKPANLSIDLSAIAKGYAVDQLAAVLEARGYRQYMVEIGGEVRASGTKPSGIPWIIGIEAPDMEIRRVYSTLPLLDMGMATSGDYRNFFAYEGRYYSHTLDPATGWPVTHDLASVTVLHQEAGYADALATAFTVLGLDKTLAIANANNYLILAIIRTPDGFETRSSNAMQAYVSKYARRNHG